MGTNDIEVVRCTECICRCEDAPNERVLCNHSLPIRSAMESMLGRANDTITRSCLIGPHESDWKQLSTLLQDTSNYFAFVRYGDGERMLILGQGVDKGTQAFKEDKFWHEGGDSQIGQDLKQSLKGHYGQRYYYGFASPRDDALGLKWFLENTEQECAYITYANLWVNGFYLSTKDMLHRILTQKESQVILIANHAAIKSTLQSQAYSFVSTLELPDDAPHVWTGKARQDLIQSATDLARKSRGMLFLVSGGPLAKVLIAEMWSANPKNRYVDFGSALDEILKGKKTRPYMDPSTAYARMIDPMWFVTQTKELKTL